MKKRRIDIIVELAKNELFEYYFDYPLPEDATDDVDLLEDRTVDRLNDLTDMEVLGELIRLHTRGNWRNRSLK